MTREEAIKAIKEHCYFASAVPDAKEALNMAVKALELDEECKKGKWEYGYSFPDGNYAKCTACGEIIKCTYPMHFCPNCGSDNRGEEQ